MTILALLAESRKREREQTRFYRALAAEAEARGNPSEAERLNDLHADEQHHLSRLTARILELGGEPGTSGGETAAQPVPEAWEDTARKREEEEVSWYRSLLETELDETSRALVEEILRSEEQHARVLGGKWMPA